MTLPVSLFYDLERIPRDTPRAALLMRHSLRHPILDPENPYEAELTEEGIWMAEEFGQRLGEDFAPRRMLTAPVSRCLATAAAIARGAGWPVEPQPDERLSHPYMFPAWRKVEHGEVNGVLPLQVRVALNLLLDARAVEPADRQDRPQLDVMVTHDTVLGAVLGCLLHKPVKRPEYWPDFLEGLVLWQANGQLYTRWRGEEAVFADPLVRGV